MSSGFVPDPHDFPVDPDDKLAVAREAETPREPEEYRGHLTPPNLDGDANEADVLDQAIEAWDNDAETGEDEG